MSATFSPRCARLTDEVRRGQRLAGAALRPEDADEPRVLVLQRRVRTLLAGHELVDLEADLLRRRREHDDVVCAGLERAPEEAVGRPVAQNHDVEIGILAGHPVQEQQGAVRIAGAGDEEQIGDAAAQPAHRLFGAGDDGDDVEVLAAGQRVLYVLGVDTGLDSEECLYRAARHQCASLLPQHRRRVRLRRLRGLRTDDRPEDEDQNCVLSAAYAHVAASAVSMRRIEVAAAGRARDRSESSAP